MAKNKTVSGMGMICGCEPYEPPKTAEERVRDSEGGSMEAGLSMQTELRDEFDLDNPSWRRQQHGTTRGG